MPSRAGGRAGDHLWVSGTIGDSGAGLRALKDGIETGAALIERYRNPRPRLEAGERLAPLVGAMMDVSDGLLIDASRLALASGVAAEIDLASVPLSDALLAAFGRRARGPAGGGDGRRRLRIAVRRRARSGRREILALRTSSAFRSAASAP